MRLFFQFKRIICHDPRAIKTNMKKIIKTENKNLYFNDKINFPKYKLLQIKTAKLHQRNANTKLQLQNQNDDLY